VCHVTSRFVHPVELCFTANWRAHVATTLPPQMLLQDAIDQLEIVDHDFYIYLDDDSGHVQVVYKRKDGDGHGIIIPIPDEEGVVV
jgi:hypothetical protein